MTPIEKLRLAHLDQQDSYREFIRGLMGLAEELNERLTAANAMIGELGDRLTKLEERPATSLDANVLTDEQLQVLGENMYHRGGLGATIANAVESHLCDEIESHISDYLDNVEIEIECSASIRDRN